MELCSCRGWIGLLCVHFSLSLSLCPSLSVVRSGNAAGKNSLCLAQPYFLALRPSRNRRKPNKVDALRLITLARDPIIFSTRRGVYGTYFVRVRTPRELSYERRRIEREREAGTVGSRGLFPRFTRLRRVFYRLFAR